MGIMTENAGAEPIIGRVLVVDDEPSACESVAALLRNAGADVKTAMDVEEAVRIVSEEQPDAVVTDVRMRSRDGFALLDSAHSIDPGLPIVLMSGYANIEDAVAAMRAGAEHYVSKPVRAPELSRVIAAAIRRRRARQRGESTDSLASPLVDERLVGESDAMRKLRAEVALAATLSTPVLVVGESGVGKRRIAELVHAASTRAGGPFVVLDCGRGIEKSLFGDEGEAASSAPRAFTAIDEAIGGTLYLENVDEMLPSVQGRLVRMLQPGRNGGSETSWNPSVRIVASSRRDVSVLRRLGAFREDLYFRLAVSEIHVPPLRERREDVPVLAEYTLGKLAQTKGVANVSLLPSALHVLQNYAWPGNDRELESVLDAALAQSHGGAIMPEHIAPRLRHESDAMVSAGVPGVTFAEMERYLILSTYEACKHNVTRTAEVLGLSPRTIHYRLREYRGLGARRRPRFGPDVQDSGPRKV
jgi:DNA-binding NtrC family response regulator